MTKIQKTKKSAEKTWFLFVCYGNICRSPMAEGFAKSMPGGVSAESAGIGASPGKAVPEAVAVMHNQYGIDISEHRTTPILDVDASRYDYIIAMDPYVYRWIRESGMFPDDKLFEWDIEDPIGMPLWVFEQVAEKIRQRLENFFINRAVI